MIKVHDLVTVKWIEGPVMLVQEILKNKLVQVVWFDKQHRIHVENFSPDLLLTFSREA